MTIPFISVEFVKNAWADIERFKEQKQPWFKGGPHKLRSHADQYVQKGRFWFQWRYEYIQKCWQISLKSVSYLEQSIYHFSIFKVHSFQNVSQFLYLIWWTVITKSN